MHVNLVDSVIKQTRPFTILLLITNGTAWDLRGIKMLATLHYFV
jgi:hypothetical protein